MVIDEKLEKIILEDIERCKEAQKSPDGTHKLFQVLISKYDGIFENFKNGVETTGKMAAMGEDFDFRPELNAIKEKLEILLATNESKMRLEDNLYDFKKQFKKDAEELKKVINNFKDIGPSQLEIIYNELIAKYSKIIPNFSDNIDGYRKSDGYFFYPQERETIQKNLKNIYEKMNICIRLNFINITFNNNESIPLLQINNNNQNSMEVNLTFKQLKERAENITSVKDDEIDEILEKINEIEEICKSNDRKTKKWEKIKKILIWIMDKGVDVAIQLIPSIINNLK